MLNIAIHPGEMLQDVIEELGTDPAEFAAQMGVSPNCLCQLLAGEAPITADLAMKLGQRLDTSKEMWLNLQANWEQASKQEAKNFS